MRQWRERSPEERAQKERFEAQYERGQSAVMLAVEREVCGCDYGGNSWTTRPEAERFTSLLELGPGKRLLDVGAGSGWPGLYMSKLSGCNAALADLPLTGIKIARQRAHKDGLADRVMALVSDAAALPFPDSYFDAISHSDLLCCLLQKEEVLASCRRVIRSQGKMAFTVLSIAPGLSRDQYRQALTNGPEFVETPRDYPALLAASGWTLIAVEDLTMDYAASCRRQLKADETHREELSEFFDEAEYRERIESWRSKIVVIDKGLLRRTLFLATPEGA